MDLIVNAAAAARSSHGVKRYLAAVLQHIAWPGRVQSIEAGRSPIVDRARELLRRGRRDAVLWTPCQRGPLCAHHHVVTVHDCINVEFVHRDDWRLGAYRSLFNAILSGAERIVAISNATRDALLRNYRIDADRVTVIRSGRTEFAPHIPVRPPTSGSPFVLMVTNALPHKNNVLACEAYARSRAAADGWPLHVVGALPEAAVERCDRHGVRLVRHAHVDDTALAALYDGCRFLLSPSLAEGHNLPISEALSRGANVLCSDIDVHREFYAGDVAFFDPARTDALVAALDEAFDRPGRWHPAAPAATRRCFKNVADDYRHLFASLAPNGAVPWKV